MSVEHMTYERLGRLRQKRRGAGRRRAQKFLEVKTALRPYGLSITRIGGEIRIRHEANPDSDSDRYVEHLDAALAYKDWYVGQKTFDISTDVTLECPVCRAYKTVPRTPDLPAEVRLIEIICPDCDDGDRHIETWYSAPGVEVSQNRE